MKKRIVSILIIATMAAGIITGCSEKDRVESNLTKEADNFNIVRKLTVMNCIEGDVLFQMSGRMSITADTGDNQLEII